MRRQQPNTTHHVAQNKYWCLRRHIIMMHLGNGDMENGELANTV